MISKFFINERIILFFIILNSGIIFLTGFNEIADKYPILSQIDNFITIIFVLEAIFKMSEYGIKDYFFSNWNKFDFVLILLAFPSLLVWGLNIEFIQLEFLLIFRILRVFKFFRFIRFIPKIDHIINGVGRASKASILILLAFFIFNFTVSLFSCYLFKEVSPEYFENP
jgi:voltage-gated sodium channel